MNIDGTTVTFEIAPDDSLFAETPTFETFTGIRHVDIQSSGRTTEIDQSQPGRIDATADLRDRQVDLAYGPAYVTYDGTGGDYWSAGDLAAISGATELDLRAAVAPDDWTPAAAMNIMSQWQATGNQRCFQFDIDTNGFLSLATSNDGTAFTLGSSNVRACAVNGQTMCVRVTWSSSGAVQFYVKRTRKGRERLDCLSHDNWLALGAVSTGVAAALHNSTTAVAVGDRVGATSIPFDGAILYADARTTIGSSTLVFAFWPADAASAAATSWTASAGAGETWTQVGTTVITIQGDYYGRVGSGTPVRVMAERGGVDYPLGYAYLRRAPQVFPAYGKDAIARLSAVDALGWLAEQDTPSTPSQFGTGTTGHYWPLHEDINVLQASDTIGNISGTWSGIRTAGGPTQPAAPSLPTQQMIEGTYLSTTEPDSDMDWDLGVFLQFNVYMPTPSAIFRVLCGNGTNTIGINYGVNGQWRMQGIGAAVSEPYDNRLAAGMHTVSIYSSAGSGGAIIAYFDGIRVAGDGSTATLIDTDNALYVDGSAAAVSDVALYQESSNNADAYVGPEGAIGQTTAERMTSLLQGAMGNVPALWDLTADASTYLGPTGFGTTYGELCRQVATAEQGRFHQDPDGVLVFRSRCWTMTATAATVSQATFGDGAGEVNYADVGVDPGSREDVINEVTVSLPNGTSGTYTDRESVTAHGLRSASYSAPLASPSDATALARHIVGLRAWPQVRITNLVINPLGDAGRWTQVLTRQIGDRITVKRRTTTTTTPSSTTQPISADVVIEQISHSIDRSGTWRTTYLTSPAPLTAQEAGYFTFDDTVLGVLNAGNVFAY